VPARIDWLVALALLAPGAALGQPPQWPTAQDIEQAVKARPFPNAAAIATQPVPRPPQLAPRAPMLDIESLARSGGRIVAGDEAPSAVRPELRIFVTLDMPSASLRLLVDQAERAGAVLVLRGLKAQSLRVTLEAVRDLIGDRQVAWLIDPEAFARYGVEQAPSFVLALDEGAGPGTCAGARTVTCTAASFLGIAGDVSLDYALESMRRQRPAAAPSIDPILRRLRAS
jgi:conjugal transfer pilus assembly protein TrbC